MRVIALAQQKGGVGKSAAAINLACQAVASGESAAIIDMDAEQGTTLKWSKRRATGSPVVDGADATTLTSVLSKYRSSGITWVFIDLPGRNAPTASAGLVAADFVIIPCRPVDVDVEASIPTVQSAKRANKRYAYLMNIAPPQVDRKRAKNVAEMLAGLGHPVAPTIIVQRIAVSDAIARGLCADENEANGPSAAEFKELFQWIAKEVSK